MTNLHSTLLAFALTATAAAAQQGGAAPVALTIYNQDFAVARTTVDLNLAAGANQVTTTNVTSQLEPDSVVLRDPGGQGRLQDQRAELRRRRRGPAVAA